MKKSTILCFMLTFFMLISWNEIYGQDRIAIITNSPNGYDSTTIDLLWNSGYIVDTLADVNIDNLRDSATIAYYEKLLAADLVIISRASSSGNFDGASKANWAEVTTPVMINSKHIMRANRLGLFPTNTLASLDTNVAVKFILPDDPITNGVTLEADSTVLFYLDNTSLLDYGADSLEATTNWKLVASCDSVGKAYNYVGIARLEKGVESYSGSGFIPGSNWTWMTKGEANDAGIDNNALTDAGKIIYLNEIAKLIADSKKKTISILTNSPNGYDSTTIVLLVDSLGNSSTDIQVLPDANIDDLTNPASLKLFKQIVSSELVIISRASSSGNFDGASKVHWAAVTAPVMINSKHVMRANRLGLFPTNTLASLDTNVAVKLIHPEDPITNGVTLEADSTVLFYLDNTSLLGYGADSLETTTNWKLVASCDSIGKAYNYVGIARLEKGVESYTGSGFIPSSNWTWMTKGEANDAGIDNNALTAAGIQIYINELKKLISESGKQEVDNTLSDLMVNGVSIDEFAELVTSYTYNSDTVPEVTATASDANAVVVIDRASKVPGTTTVTVVGSNPKQYRVYFPSTDATLSEILVDSVAIPGFNPDVLEYSDTLAEGTITVPKVLAMASDVNAKVVIAATDTLPGTTTITVTAENGVENNIYLVNFVLVPTGVSTQTYNFDINIAPNPFDENVSISFEIPVAGPVRISIVDIAGHLVKEVFYEGFSKDFHSFNINTGNLNKGIYLIKIQSGEYSVTRKLLKK